MGRPGPLPWSTDHLLIPANDMSIFARSKSKNKHAKPPPVDSGPTDSLQDPLHDPLGMDPLDTGLDDGTAPFLQLADPDDGKGKKKKKKQKKLKKGQEISKHKGGTVEAHGELVALMQQSDSERIEEIAELLIDGKTTGLQLFYALMMRLSGDNKDLERRYREVTYRPLREDLQSAVTPEQYDYLRNTLMYGEPRLEDRIKLAAGITTKTACDTKEVIHLFEEVADDAERLRIWRSLGDLLLDVMGKKAKRLQAQAKTVEMESDLKAKKEAGQDVRERNSIPMDLYFQKDEELVAIAETCAGELGLKRDKLAEVLPAWAARQPKAIRDYVTGPGGLFLQFLYKQEKKRFALVHQNFTKHDLEYVVRMVRNAEPVDDAFFQDGVETSEIESDKARKKREEQRSESGAQHTELVAYVDRKTHTSSAFKGKAAFETLQERIEGLSDAERDAFLREYLSDADKDKWDDSKTPHQERLELRKKAVEEGLNVQLKKAGLRNLGGGKGDLTSMRKRFKAAFAYGAADNTTNSGGTYQRLVSHSKGKVVRHTKFGKDTLGLLRKLRGDEFAQVRGDAELMDRLRRKSAKKYRARIDQILGVTSGTEDKSGGEATSDVLNETDTDGQVVRDREEARDLAVDEAELQPSHWALMIGSTVKDSHHKRRTEVNSMVTRAWTAGKRRERLTKAGPKPLSGDRLLEPMTAEDFVKAVDAQLTKGAKRALKAAKFKAARHALREGRRPSVDEQIDDAKYTNQMKRTSGADLGQDRLLTMVDDLEGRDLLEEWSNIGAFEAIYAEHMEASTAQPPEPEKVRELTGKLDRFVLQIREDRQREIWKLLPPGQATKTIAKVQTKLSKAMQSDPEVQETLHQAHFVNDEIAQSETRALGQLDEQRMRSTGAQYNSYSGPTLKNPFSGKELLGKHSGSAQTKDSTGVLLGRTRGVHSQLRRGEDRKQVAKENAKSLKEAQDDLDRRGKAFDELRAKYNKLASQIIKALVRAVVMAGLAVFTGLTGGVGGILAVAVMAGKTLLMETIMKVVESKLEGDAFNVVGAVWDVTFKTLIAAATSAVGEFASPEVASALGAPVALGDGLSTASEIGGAGMTPGEAAAAGFGRSLKKGTKGLLRTVVRELRETDDRPGKRARMGVDLGFLVLGMGAAVGKEAAASWSQQEENDPNSTKTDKKLSGGVAQGTGKAAKGLKYAKRLIDVKPQKHTVGDDRKGDLTLMVEGALQQSEPVIKDLESQTGDPDVEMDVIERLALLVNARVALEKAFEEWKASQDEKKAGEHQLMAGAASEDLLEKVFDLQLAVSAAV